MKRLPVLAMATAVMLASPTVLADSTVHGELSGYDETPSAISTTATGSFKAKINDDSVEYELSYADLESDVTQAHIHFGKPGVSGGIAAWLCVGTGPVAPAGTPACAGARTGGASGVITAASVVGPAGQGIAPGEFEEFVAAIKAGAAYANVHSTGRPGGEIRGAIK